MTTARTRLLEAELVDLAPFIDWDFDALALRFMAKIDADGDCWLWTGAVNHLGYGRFAYGGTDIRAHRAAWCLLVGPCPEDLVPDHRCYQTGCANPDHLEWITEEENIRRSNSASARNQRATRCPQKHPYDEANTVWRVQKGRKRRECRVCVNEQSRERKRRARLRLVVPA